LFFPKIENEVFQKWKLVKFIMEILHVIGHVTNGFRYYIVTKSFMFNFFTSILLLLTVVLTECISVI
jgi:hypothetical protein